MSLIKSNTSGLTLIWAFLIVAMITGCRDEQVNQLPELDIQAVPEGLKITLQGKITDSDGSISDVIVNWGDSKTEHLVYADYAALKVSHSYREPAMYSIQVSAFDNTGDSTKGVFPVQVDFRETSLDGIKQRLLKTSPHEYLILTMNMHTYQESFQNEKFNLITDVIGKMDIDFVALQECAQNKASTITSGIIRNDNMALIITDRLKAKYNINYNFIWNWAHYGWDVWEEGVAVLSKHPLQNSEDRYISASMGTSSITSRKVIYGSYNTSDGLFNIFSAHTHWRLTIDDEEQNNQITKIKLMAAEKQSAGAETPTLICGDFNGNPTSDFPWSEGYNTMMMNNEYTDSYFLAYPDANTKPAQSQHNTIGGDFPGRIDYIFMKNNAHLEVVESQIIFTPTLVGTISDHFGVITKVRYVQ